MSEVISSLEVAGQTFAYNILKLDNKKFWEELIAYFP
jgi:hypothetical protein